MQSFSTSSISVISLIITMVSGKLPFTKNVWKKLGTPLNFLSFQTQDTLTSRNLRCKSREFPQKKLDLVSLKSVNYYRVAIFTHTFLLLFLHFSPVCQQPCLSDKHNLIFCYQILTNTISTSTKHSLSKSCFRVLQKSTRFLPLA